jgi:hypothetical protein
MKPLLLILALAGCVTVTPQQLATYREQQHQQECQLGISVEGRACQDSLATVSLRRAAGKYGCADSLALRVGRDSTEMLSHPVGWRQRQLHLGSDGPCEVLRIYGARFETRHVDTINGSQLIWFYDLEEASFFFARRDGRWVLTDVVR